MIGHFAGRDKRLKLEPDKVVRLVDYRRRGTVLVVRHDQTPRIDLTGIHAFRLQDLGKQSRRELFAV
jgi:hypothetical protein